MPPNDFFFDVNLNLKKRLLCKFYGQTHFKMTSCCFTNLLATIKKVLFDGVQSPKRQLCYLNIFIQSR